MAIQGLGTSFTYWYNAQTGKLSSGEGEEDVFVKFFNGEPMTEEEQNSISQYDISAKTDIKNMLMIYSEKDWEGALFHETDTDLFEINGELIDDGCAKYKVNGTERFKRLYGELRYNPSVLVKESGAIVQPLAESGTTKQSGMTGKAGTTEFSGETDLTALSSQELRELLREQINNGYLDGTKMVAPSFPIGVMSFTEEEWEEFLERLDLAIEAVRMASKEEAEKEMEFERKVTDDIPVQSLEETAEKAAIDTGLLLSADTSECTYPSEEEDVLYQVFYTEKGIVCKRFGEKEPVWELPYENPEDYEKIMGFMNHFADEEGNWNTQNLRFAAHKNFWEDYLNGLIDESDFLEFFAGAEDGIPSFLIRTEDGYQIDYEHLWYERYFSKRRVD